MITNIDLFAGIGGFALGLQRGAGIQTVAHVEIDKSCQEVLKKNFPEHLIFSDVREVGAHNLPKADMITFGSPCQDLSIAGKREGLQGERSGLFHEAIRIVREIKPRFAIWENVPGALSSNKGEDFRTVLSQLCNASVPMPRSGRWAKAGVVRSGQTEVAWRILDAQYFGVPQRRRRIFVVASFGNTSASEILFESEGVRWDTPPRRKTGEGITPSVASGVNNSGLRGRQPGSAASLVSPTLRSGIGGTVSYGRDALVRSVSVPLPSKPYADNVSQESKLVTGTLDQKSYGANRGSQANETDFILCTHETGKGFWSEGLPGLRSQPGGISENIIMSTGQGNAEIVKDGSPSLNCNHEAPILVTPINTMAATRPQSADENRQTFGIGEPGDPMFTLQENHSHAIAWEMQHASEVYRESGDIAPNLQARMGTGGNNVPLVGVRRLTPTECARLQGFPDDWNDHLSDSARYKQFGNAVCVNVIEWIGKRIKRVLDHAEN